MITPFLQVSDNSKTLAAANSLNNTNATVILSGINTTSFPAVTSGYMVTIWNETAYPDPSDDPNMEKAHVTAATIGANGSFTITRTNAKAHPGNPRIALLVLAQHISELQDAVSNLQATDVPRGFYLKDTNGVVYKVTVDTDQSLTTEPYDGDPTDTAFPFGSLGLGFF